MRLGGTVRRPQVHHRTAVSAVDAAWLVLIPWALLTLAAVVFAGPPLERVLFPPLDVRFLSADPEPIAPERLENTRYLLLVLAAGVLAVSIAFASRRALRLSPRAVRAIAAIAQAAGASLIVLCLAIQHGRPWETAYFNLRTLAAAAALTALVAIVVSSEPLRRRAIALGRDPGRPTRAVLVASALLITAVWLLPAVNSESSIGWGWYHDIAFHFDETFAVINGLTPLVDFNAQYASLFPYVVALSMGAFGKTLLVFTITLCVLSTLILCAVYGVLRRAAGSATLGFLLYVPFMATSLFTVIENPLGRFSPGTYFPMFPFRYGMPYLVAWLLARHLNGERPSRTWPLFLASGFAILNNFEFGVGALAATIVAVVWTSRPTPRSMLRLAGNVVAGLSGAVAIFSIFALIRAGSLPHFARDFQFIRIYALGGYSSRPIPSALGLPLVIYSTFVAAIAVGTVRAAAGARNATLTGMLVWAGVFGLASGSYYVVRSTFALLAMTFSAWALAVALLCIVAVRMLATQRIRARTAAGLAVVFAMGVAACSLAQAPAPWTQVERVRQPPADAVIVDVRWAPRPSQAASVRRFVAALASGPHRFVIKHGAPVAIFVTTGHRVADAYGVRDVVPVTGPESIHTAEQLESALEALRRAGGNTALVGAPYVQLLRDGLARNGFAILTERGPRMLPPDVSPEGMGVLVVDGYTKWIDLRHIHPAALREG